MVTLVISGREDASVKEAVVDENELMAAIPTLEVEVPYKLSSLVPPKRVSEAMVNGASTKMAELNQVPVASADKAVEATELVSEEMEMEMHKMPDGSWMPGSDHAHAMHKMSDGSWMRGVSHKQAVHKMPDGSWMPGMTHEAAQAIELTAKDETQENPAATAGVSKGPIVNPKSIVNAIAPKKKVRQA